jgi:hypothetical protein
MTGADWSNAYAGLPATLVRGDIYYLADGNYGTYTFNTAASGTLTVEIRKAQSYDNCTSTGWNTGTMGSSQATFSGTPAFTVSSSYLTLNGNGQQTAPGCGGAPGSSVSGAAPNPKGCGINITDTNYEGMVISGSFTNLTVEYVEFLGSGINNSNSIAEVISSGLPSNTTWSHIYGHDAGCVFFQYLGSNRTVSNSYFWGTETGGGGACHGQYSFDTYVSNWTEFNNVYRDITGTAVWTLGSWGGLKGVANNISLYDNVVYNSYPAASWSPFLSDGLMSCIGNSGSGTSMQCSNITMAQNTFVNLGGNSGINNDCTLGCGSGSSYTVQNNIWYASVTPAFMVPVPATWTQEYNSCLNSGTCPSGSNNVTNASSPNPFTNWTGGVFTLASDNASWNNRLSLSSPYNTDAAGNAFTTDRGAYQYISGPPQPPSNVTSTAH